MILEEKDYEKLSPMMRHYIDTKEQYPDAILFYRLGDFYEMFFEDARIVSKELELTLTGKACGLDERAPMCGVPFHASDTYLNRLVSKGYKVAICEQVEDPQEAKGIVKREVIRVVTPGTNLNLQGLQKDSYNYLFSIAEVADAFGIAYTDVTTGDFYVTQCETLIQALDELTKTDPKEVLCTNAFRMQMSAYPQIMDRLHCLFTPLDGNYFDEKCAESMLKDQFHVTSLQGLGLDAFRAAVPAAGALVQYLNQTQKQELRNLTGIHTYLSGSFMRLDAATRRNLELTETMREKEKKGSLFWVLDKTKTAMGARTLRRMIEQPLVEMTSVQARLNAVDTLIQNTHVFDEIREYLTPVYDFERLMGKIAYLSANPKDLLAFAVSVKHLPAIRIALSDVVDDPELHRLSTEMDPLQDLYALITSAIDEDAPLTVKEGGIIRDGYSAEIDRFKAAGRDGKQWIAELEEAERARTGIKTLRINFSNNFGYSFEVTNSFKDKVPEEYIRKQTLTNCERYTTPRLKELEDEILNATDKCNRLEYECFCAIRDSIGVQVERIKKTAQAVATLDVYASLAFVAEKNHYVKPEVDKDGVISIHDGRHPVIEQMMDTSMHTQMFIANDTLLDNGSHQISIITGPNMAGKSTYMRQVALIVLMSQIGSFVPASKAHIGICDRIFTRVGASDDLASGQSTFMVEMNEMSNILRNATKDSLLILDEIGRGTSTYDGLSIAWAVIEHIADKNLLGAKTLFATHYHELTALEEKIPNVHNFCIAVRESGDEIVFLRKIIKGSADKSYGIQVARIAGVPDLIIDRAEELLSELTADELHERVRAIDVKEFNASPHKPVKKPDEVDLNQMSFLDTDSDTEVIREIKDIKIETLTPMDALNLLYRLQGRLRNRFKNNESD